MPLFPRALAEFFTAVLMPTPQALQFALKNMIAGAVALYLAFILQMDQPQWALTTVFIVNQPMSGMVLSKGAYRLLGTFIGAVVSLGMIAAFGQSPLLFLLTMALWLGGCTAGASLFRNNVSYGFVLAGYTTAIIALPSTAAPLQVFDQAQSRFCEIVLGILCASVISTVLWPRRIEQQLAAQARDAWKVGMAAAASELLGVDQHKGLLEALRRIVSVDAQRDHAAFEGPLGRLRAQSLRVMSRDLLSLLRTARGVARHHQMLDSTSSEFVDPFIAQVAQALEDGTQEVLAEQARIVEGLLPSPGLSPQSHACLIRLTVVLELARAAATTVAAVESGEPVGNAPGPLAWHRDIRQGLFSGLRSATAFLAVAVLWVFTAWPAGLGAVSISGVVLSLFASRDEPSAAALGFFKGIALSVPVAALVGYALLPQWEGFPMLCLGLGVPLFVASLCISRPPIAPVASAFCIFFVNNVAPDNVMNYDFGQFFNKALATLVGVGIAVVVFRLITLSPGQRYYQRLVNASLADLVKLTRRPLHQVEGWFGGRMADRLMRLAGYRAQHPEEPSRAWDIGFYGLDLGGELLHLRACLSDSSGTLTVQRDRYLRRIARLLKEGPPAPEQAVRLNRASQQLLAALATDEQLTARREELARLAVLQVQFIWREWTARMMQEPSISVAADNHPV